MECNCKRDDEREELPVKYWKLTCPVHTQGKRARTMMESRNFHCPKSASKTRVMQLLHRSERGQLSYDKCSTSELRVFVAARGLSNPGKGKPTGRRALVGILEAADDSPSFHFFMDLPPEMHLRIYELHFATFDTVDAEPPPLLQVCRVIRHEARPVFYDQCRLMLRVGYAPLEEDDWRPDHNTSRLAEFDTRMPLSRYGLCRALFNELDGDLLTRINRFTLDFMWNGINIFDVDLLADNDEDMVKRADFDYELHCRAEARFESDRHEAREAHILRKLLKIAKGIAEREGKGKLRRGDLAKFASGEMENVFFRF